MSASSLAVLKRPEPFCEPFLEVDQLPEGPDDNSTDRPGFDGVVGSSRALRAVLDQVRIVAPTDSTVLIEGETGTGKEVIANAIHQNSRSRNRPLIKLNCAAI